jgi:hypothetical protein
MRSCLQCRAVTSREGGEGDMKSPLTLSSIRMAALLMTPAYTQDSMIKREIFFFFFSSPFFWIFLSGRVRSPPHPGFHPENVASNHKQQQLREIRLMASIRNSLLSPLAFALPSLTSLPSLLLCAFRIDMIPFQSVDHYFAQDFLCTR